MESTYYLNRFNKGLCWFAMIVGAAGILGTAVWSAKLAYWVSVSLTAGKHAAAVFGLILCFPFVFGSAAIMVGACRMLRIRVSASDAGVRVGDWFVAWRDIQSVDHPARTIGLAFRISTRDGRSVTVPPVVDSLRLEELVKERLSTGAATESEPAREYVLGRKWGLWLSIIQFLLAAGSAASFLGLIARLAGHRGFEDMPSFAWSIPVAVYLIALPMLSCALSWSKRVSGFRVTVFEQAIRIGEVTAKWSEIDQIEQSRMPGVAFRVRTRDGKRLNVYSGLENLGGLESVITQRLAATR